MRLFKDKNDIAKFREGGQRLAAVLEKVAAAVRPGITTGELDRLASDLITARGDRPAFLHYQPRGAAIPYPASLCTSVDEEVVHGIPGERVLVEGEIIGLDLGLEHEGFFTDMAVTVPVGRVAPEAEALIVATKEALARAIKAVRAGATVGDIGAAVESFIKPKGYGIVRDLCGHGVGFAIHDEPSIPNFGQKGKGTKLVAGQGLAIEPMINLGRPEVRFENDGFTVTTRDGSLSAHFEHTILVTEKGAEIITQVKK